MRRPTSTDPHFLDGYSADRDRRPRQAGQHLLGSARGARTPRPFLQSENAIFQQMAAQGQSVLSATGDNGAYDDAGLNSIGGVDPTAPGTLSVDDPKLPALCDRRGRHDAHQRGERGLRRPRPPGATRPTPAFQPARVGRRRRLQHAVARPLLPGRAAIRAVRPQRSGRRPERGPADRLLHLLSRRLRGTSTAAPASARRSGPA